MLLGDEKVAHDLTTPEKVVRPRSYVKHADLNPDIKDFKLNEDQLRAIDLIKGLKSKNFK